MGCAASSDPLKHLDLPYAENGTWWLDGDLHSRRQARALAPFLPSSGISQLDLSGNPRAFGGAGGDRVLVDYTAGPPNLKLLNLSSCKLSGGAESPGLATLGEALAGLPKFSALLLGSNPGLSGLPPALAGAARVEMQLDGCEGLGASAGQWAPHLSQTLVMLYLSSVPLGDTGVEALAPHLPPTLTSLDLSRVGMGDEGMAALAPHLPRRLTRFTICNGTSTVKPREGDNRMTPDSVDPLLQYLPKRWTGLPSVLAQQFGTEGVQRLREALSQCSERRRRRRRHKLHMLRAAQLEASDPSSYNNFGYSHSYTEIGE